MKSLVLLGGGGHCVACIDVIEQQGRYRIVGILDREDLLGQALLGYCHIGTDNDVPDLIRQGHQFLVTVGQVRSAEPRQRLYGLLTALQAPVATVVSPRAYVSKHAKLGIGTVVMHDALINAGAEVGCNCIINTKALVEHDACIEDHCHISTAAVVNGGARIKAGTFFGSGAVSQEYACSVSHDFIKAGSVLKRQHE
jgi:sugar O-acyltransferase (sialic acid O-acetyltransferase NeuD family)